MSGVLTVTGRLDVSLCRGSFDRQEVEWGMAKGELVPGGHAECFGRNLRRLKRMTLKY